MTVDLRWHGVMRSSALEERVLRSLGFALLRFDERIAGVRVWLEDVNGPRGGRDKLCRVQVRGRAGWLVTVQERGTDLYGVVDGATGRAGRSVGRAIDRARAVPRPATARSLPLSGPSSQELA